MKKLIILMVFAAMVVPMVGHAGEVRLLEWANEDGSRNRIDWEVSKYTIGYLYQSTYIGFTGSRGVGDSIRVQVTNMNDRRRIKVYWNGQIEWTGFSFNYHLMPSETRLYEFQAIHDPFVPGVTVRGRVIY